MMCGGLSAIGWSDEAQILDHGTPPLRIAMDAAQLNDALRATSLLKQGKGDDEGPKVNCVMGPLRDGNGWASAGFRSPDECAATVADIFGRAFHHAEFSAIPGTDQHATADQLHPRHSQGGCGLGKL
ncbi:hypothetical protein [Streptomyces mirabilis]|uniref:hypothetical protein n=1 Tax=Streptomyces mirabilis TaxID=68239 RepID=UPI0033B6BD05